VPGPRQGFVDRIGGSVPAFTLLGFNTSGDHTIVTPSYGHRIRVIQCALLAHGAVFVYFRSGAGGTALTGSIPMTLNTGFVLNFSNAGWFETADGETLEINLSGDQYVGGVLAYVEV